MASGGPVNCAFSLLTAGNDARRYVVPVAPGVATTVLPAMLFGVTVPVGVPGVGAGPTLSN